MAKVTGLGGVFVRARDPKRLTAWYAEHLGLPVTEWGGVVFVWEKCAAPEGCGCTVWSLVSPGYRILRRQRAGGDAELSCG